jgi:hypothetical protein
MGVESNENLVTGAEVGINGDEQIRIALHTAVANGGVALMSDIIEALGNEVKRRHLGKGLSEQGKAALRRCVNSDAVKAGYLLPHDKRKPGWHITPKGRKFLQSSP